MTLDDLEPLRAAIDRLPPHEQEAAAKTAGDAIAAKLLHDATTQDGILRRLMPAVPLDPPPGGLMPRYTVTHTRTRVTKATVTVHAASPTAAATHFERVMAGPARPPEYRLEYKPVGVADASPEYAVTDAAGVKSYFYAGLSDIQVAADTHAQVFDLVKTALSQQGDDVCWRDLYNPEVAALVGVDFDPKLLAKPTFLGNCGHFYDYLAREKPYVAPADHYETLRATLRGLPGTWYPDLLRAAITAAHDAGVFLPGGAAAHAAAVESEIGQSPTTEDPSTTT